MTTETFPPVDLRPLRERLADVRLDEVSDSLEANDRLYRAGLTDGLPVVPPWTRLVESMLHDFDPAGVPHVDPLPPGFAVPTPEDVAVCAVLAGCEAGALPLIFAALSAASDPAFNLLGIQTTTGSAAPLFIVGGSAVQRFGLNAGPNAMGPGWRPNATIGRAIRLVLQNVGLAVPGTGDMATHGQPGKYTWLVAENDADSPWEPLHATRGFDLTAGVVTAVGATGNVEAVLPLTTPEALAATLARSMTIGGNIGRGWFGAGQSLILLPPECAQFLDRNGWDRARLQEQLYREARVPLDWLGEHGRSRVVKAREEQGLPPEGDIYAVRSPESVLIAVTGGTGMKSTVVPTWAGGTEAITRVV